MASLSSLFCVLVFYNFIQIQTTCHGYFQQQQEKGVVMFIFGDSLFDPGNNNYINTTTEVQANFLPYGNTFFGFPTGRFSDGRLIPDFIAEHANLPLIPPFLQPGGFLQFINGANFASSGAGALVETYQGMAIDLNTQVSYFKKLERWMKHKLGNEEASKMFSRAVYLISIGSNDYMFPHISNSSTHKSYSQIQYLSMVIGNITKAIREIHSIGGRKFGFVGMGPLGCLPGVKILKQDNNGSCIKEASAIAQLHNGILSSRLKDLETQLEGFKYSNPDAYTALSQLMEHPTTYGFQDGQNACCGIGPYRGVLSCGGKRAVKEYELCENVNEYVFFDSFHPTEKANQLMAGLMWSGPPDIVGPYNLKDLFESA